MRMQSNIVNTTNKRSKFEWEQLNGAKKKDGKRGEKVKSIFNRVRDIEFQ